MSDPLRAKFQQWLLVYVLAPMTVLVLIGNFFLARALQQKAGERLAQQSLTAHMRVEESLHTEVMRMRTVAGMPVVSALLNMEQRRDRADETPEKIEQEWGRSERDALLVRSVLDNDVAAALQRIRTQEPHINRMMLVDNRGNVLAATEKTERYGFFDQPWMKHARSSPAGGVSAENIDTNGLVTLVADVLRTGYTNAVEGRLADRVDVQALLNKVTFGGSSNDLVYLLGPGVLPVVGTSNQVARLHGYLVNFLNSGERTGWVHGYRFQVYQVDGGVSWRDKVLLVAALEEPRIPAALFFSVVGSIAIGILMVFGFYLLARRQGLRWLILPMREASEAGVWIIRTAYGEEAKEKDTIKQSWAAAMTERTSAIQRELTRWLNKLRQDLQAQQTDLSLELRRDLELATEFQQAFLNRPYPRVPEVHTEGRLRLEFGHCYQPALAMGGDFFEISALSQDCAGVFVADVMGHGTRSALIVSILRTLIAELSRRGRNAPHFIRELNTNFCTMLSSLPSPFFASAAYLVADTTARVATYALAGHPPPFYLHRAMGRLSRLEMPKPQGVALGLIPNEEYGGCTVRLNPGDGFIFFTDGVYEAANREGEEFGLPRLEKVIKANVYRSSPEILQAILKAIHDFVGDEPVADDICLVTVDVTTDPVKTDRA